MNFNKIIVAGIVVIAAIEFGVVYSQTKTNSSTSTSSSVKATTTSTDLDTSVISTDDMFSERDLEQTYDSSKAVTVTLADNASKSSADGVSIDGNTVTITKEGVYVFSGSLSNGAIVVNAGDDAKVQIVLNGVDITNNSSACIYSVNANKVFLTTADGSNNTLHVSGDYKQTDDNNVDAAIFSKTDLTINGTGTLTVKADYGHGIVCKDDLVITGSTINVTSVDHAINGKNSIRIAAGTLNLTTGEDGLHSGNDDDSTVGYIYMKDGDITINAKDDGIHADLEVRIDGGNIDIESSYEGIEGAVVNVVGGKIALVSSDDGFNSAGGSDSTGQQADMFATEDGVSLNFYGGDVTVDASGDGLDSNGDLLVAGGTIYVSGPTNDGNGALDYNGAGTITGGTVIATGSSGMALNFDSDSTQGTIMVNLDATTSDEVSLLDSDGKVLASFTPSKEYNNVVVSTADIKDGSNYTVKAGNSETKVTMDGLVYGESSTMGGGQRGGMMPNQNSSNSSSSNSSSSDSSSSDSSSSDNSKQMQRPARMGNGSNPPDNSSTTNDSNIAK